MFGNHLLESVAEDRKDDIIKKVENSLKEILYREGNWIADYKRIRVMGIKE